MNSGDTAWVLISAAMVFFMTPGVAFFYGGMARRKNVLSIMMQCFLIVCMISLQWGLFGYSLAFGPDSGQGLIGGFEWFGLQGVGFTPFDDYAKTIPHIAFMIFQAMFAVITPALIIGAFAERIKFSSFCVFTLLWATLVYDPIAHWIWGNGGWLKNMGALDFAGGMVVHVSSGITALVMCLLIGKRIARTRLCAAQSAADRPGRRHALVRMVRLQCRKRPRGERSGRQCLSDDEYVLSRRGSDLGAD